MSNRKPPVGRRPGPKGNKKTAAFRGPSFPGRRRRGPEGDPRRLLRRRRTTRKCDAEGEPSPATENSKSRSTKIGRSQRLHPMAKSCLVALRAGLSVLPRRLQVVAGGWAYVVDAAMRGDAHLADERLAARLVGVRATHRDPMRVQVLR